MPANQALIALLSINISVKNITLMKALFSNIATLSIGLILPFASIAQNTTEDIVVEVKSPTIMQYFVDQAPEFATLIRIIKASALEDNISNGDAFTVLAPKNRAFDALPESKLADLMMPQNIGLLRDLLTFHIIAGSYTLDDLKRKINEGGGSFTIRTIGQGGNLVFLTDSEGNIMVKDYKGSLSPIGNPIIRNNGVIYTLDTVLSPQEKL
jgi:uncharacterized surface protein with fasciclin (FAS1) repeats